MELFTKTMAVKLRSHLDKYLIADDDGETIRQSRNGSTRHARWLVERVEGTENSIRLKTIDGRYLTASDTHFLLGMTGKRVIQTKPEKITDWNLQWEPARDGFQVRLQSWCGKFLRANGGTPPWRNTVTHDEPHTGSTVRWILWDVEAVETESLAEYLSSMSSMSSVPDDVLEAASDEYLGSEPGSPISVVSSLRTHRLTVVKSMSPRLSPKKTSSNQFRSGMEFFRNAKAVRLRSHHDKYLHAEEDEETVTQDRNGSSRNAKWIVESVPGSDSIIRLKSCYGKYLTASNQPFLLGMTGRKVLQTLPRRLDSSLEWEPIKESGQVKLKTRYANFLRANGGLPPWRNSVTHDIPHRTATQDWVLWDVDIVEIQVKSSRTNQEKTEPPPAIPHSDSLDFDDSSSPSSVSIKSSNFSRQESSESNVSSPPKSEGRTIYYHVADESGDIDDDVVEAYYFHFKGNGVDELTQKLREETGLQDIVVCSRSPLNGKLYPLRLQLPPNNADMHVVIVESSSKARDLAKGVVL
ncbi:uncharacterized protein LOC8287041 isoform X2 [Ricinus communis]|uniref:uncharacterized protein LOC8287041 isoform X2 n=1 Tax=Ricinus communis TaxID=3988 RepID=UPI000D68B920|nr:uncharacterized protein LOC8287041 isoform X2 [Ricinus communis]|eukprot:XP_025013297.1 uncharacterized protein LOC8287041 isoform X2 [Ricinus communis]